MELTVTLDEVKLREAVERVLTGALSTNSYQNQRAEEDASKAVRDAIGVALRSALLAMIADPSFALELRTMIRDAVFAAIRARVDGLTKGMPRGVAQGLFDAIAAASQPEPTR